MKTSSPISPEGKVMAAAKYKIGDHVKHVARDDKWPAGTGIVTEVIPGFTGLDFRYLVKCDASGKVLPDSLDESELELCC